MSPRLPSGLLERPIAHRGLHDVQSGRPENSLVAAFAAIDANYGIELDVQLSADGHAMVFHDYHLERLTNGTGIVRQHTASELGKIQLTGGDEGIPTLVEFLDLVAGRVPVLIELKDQDGAMGPDVGLLEQSVTHAVSDYAGEVAVMSYNPHSTGAMQTLLPGVARGLVTEDFPTGVWPVPDAVLNRMREIPDFERVGASFISHEAADLDMPRVAALKECGANILCWTVRSHEAEIEARKIADNITFENYLP